MLAIIINESERNSLRIFSSAKSEVKFKIVKMLEFRVHMIISNDYSCYSFNKTNDYMEDHQKGYGNKGASGYPSIFSYGSISSDI